MINYKGFIEHYFKIKNKEGNVVPFIFNNVQDVYYEILLKDYSGLKGIRENILKARKEGFSSLVAGIFTASLEAGWYLGGINGAGLSAKIYNDRLYSELGKEALSSAYV